MSAPSTSLRPGTDTLVTPRQVPFGSETAWVAGVPSVERYLGCYPGLAAEIPDLLTEVRREFEAEAEVSLQVNHDPEAPDPFLIVMVRLPSYDAGVYDRLVGLWDRLDAHPAFAQDQVFVTTDYSPPRFAHAV